MCTFISFCAAASGNQDSACFSPMPRSRLPCRKPYYFCISPQDPCNVHKTFELSAQRMCVCHANGARSAEAAWQPCLPPSHDGTSHAAVALATAFTKPATCWATIRAHCATRFRRDSCRLRSGREERSAATALVTGEAVGRARPWVARQPQKRRRRLAAAAVVAAQRLHCHQQKCRIQIQRAACAGRPSILTGKSTLQVRDCGLQVELVLTTLARSTNCWLLTDQSLARPPPPLRRLHRVQKGTAAPTLRN